MVTGECVWFRCHPHIAVIRPEVLGASWLRFDGASNAACAVVYDNGSGWSRQASFVNAHGGSWSPPTQRLSDAAQPKPIRQQERRRASRLVESGFVRDRHFVAQSITLDFRRAVEPPALQTMAWHVVLFRAPVWFQHTNRAHFAPD